MMVALTGTPGTGKTTIARILERKYHVVYLKDYEEARREYDRRRDTYTVDMEYLAEKVRELRKYAGKIIIEGHYSHEFSVDIVIVLRCHPDELMKRLEKRNYKKEKIMENVEAEAMSLITSEAINRHGRDKVYEIDTTKETPETVAEEVEEIVEGKNLEKYVPRINYSEVILGWY